MKRSSRAALCMLVTVPSASARPPIRPGSPADLPTSRPRVAATRPDASTRAATRPKAKATSQPAGPAPAAMLGSVPGHFRPAVAHEGIEQSAGRWLDENYRGKIVTLAGIATAPVVKTAEGKSVISLKLYAKKPERWGRLTVGLSVPLELTVDAAQSARYEQIAARRT